MTTLFILLFATLAPAVVLLAAGFWMVRKLRGDVSRALGVLAIVLGLLLVILAILLVLLVQTSTTVEEGASLGTAPDMPVYSSIRELLSASDLVVVGTVKGVAAREVDYGTTAPDERDGQVGVPTVLYEVAATEKLHGTEARVSIIVGAPDVDEILTEEDSSDLQLGQRVLLFLKRQTSEDAPGIAAYGEFYVTVSLKHGVFDVVGDDWVEPRMSRVFGETRYSLQQIREEASSTRSGPDRSRSPDSSDTEDDRQSGVRAVKSHVWPVLDPDYDDSWVANVPEVIGGYRVINIGTPKSVACSSLPIVTLLAPQQSMDEFLKVAPDARSLLQMLQSIPGVPSDVRLSFAGSAIDEEEAAANLARWNERSLRDGCIRLGGIEHESPDSKIESRR